MMISLIGENLKKKRFYFFRIISLCRFGLCKFVIMISRKLSELGALTFVSYKRIISRSIGENLKKGVVFCELSPFADLDFENF